MRDREGKLMTEQQIADQMHEMRHLRNQYYPNSFIYEGREIPDNLKPWYKVTVHTTAELALAKSLQPSNVRAEIVLTTKPAA